MPSPGNRPIECLEQEQPGSPAPIDPLNCPVAPAVVVVNPATHVKTTCSDGPMAMAAQPVATCVPGFDPATSGNGWVASQCDRNVVSPAAPFNGVCAGTTQGPFPSYFVFICTRPPANNQTTPVRVMRGRPAHDRSRHVRHHDLQPARRPDQPAGDCVSGVRPWRDDRSRHVRHDDLRQGEGLPRLRRCVRPNAGILPPYDKVVCTPSTLSNNAVAAGSCVVGNSGAPAFIQTACPRTPAGPNAVAAPQLACAPDPGATGPNFYETTCTNPPGVNNQTKFVTAAACGPLGISNSGPPNFITSDCRKPAGAEQRHRRPPIRDSASPTRATSSRS